jgi:tetratricopeptide (TPR) repeat protein
MTTKLLLVCCILALQNSATEPPVGDITLMRELQAEIEALPPDRRESEGVQVLLNNVSKFRSEEIQKRVYLSIAELLRSLGRADDSLVYFIKAGRPDGQAEYPSGIAAISRGKLLDALEQDGNDSAVLQQALNYRDAPSISDTEYAELTYKAGLSLISSGDLEAGVALGIEAAVGRPCIATYQCLETLLNDANLRNTVSSRDSYLKGMHWLRENSGDFGETRRFLGNLAHAEEASGNFLEAIKAVRRQVEKYPEPAHISASFLRLAGLYMQIGDNEQAKIYLRRVVEGDGPPELIQRAENALQLFPGETRVTNVMELEQSRSNSVLIVVLNSLFFTAVAGSWLWRRYYRR